MLSRNITMLLSAVLIGMTLCLPMLDAGQCSPVYHCAAPVCHTPPALCHDSPPVFVSPFVPLDVFVFVGLPQPLAVAPPAGGDFRTSGKTESGSPPVAFPKARGYAGQTSSAVQAPAFDAGQVAAALSSCTACHTAPSGKSGVNIFAANGAFDPKVSPAAILASVQSDSMPLRGAKLTPPQKKVIADWVAATASKGS